MSRITLSIYDHVDNPHYGGGGALVVEHVALRLAAEHDVTVFCGSYRGCKPGVSAGVRYRFLPVGWAGARGGQVLFQLLLPLVALVHRTDLWIESLTPPASVSLVPLTARAPVLALVQMLCGADMQRRYRLPFKAIERRGLRLYRNFIVLNDIDAELVRAANPGSRVETIPNGVDLPDMPDTPGDETADAQGPILYLGRIDVRQKGLDLLLAAVVDEPSVRLDIAGSGTPAEMSKLRALIPAAAASRIRLLGRVDGERKERLLRDCLFAVVPSRYETFCLTALEAMSYARPVVHFDLERLSWIGDASGIAVPAFDVAALRAAILDLLVDAPRRADLGRGARERSLGYAWPDVTLRYRALVADLLGTPQRPLFQRPLFQRRSRLRSAERRSRVVSGRRDTTSDRARSAPETAPRSTGPVLPGNTSMRTCSRVPVAKSDLYDSLSPNKSSSPNSGSAKA
ncbi:MAG: glycosyltransferase family 4 protein [Pseudonocardiales bacterium]|nr:glycosyltransferase family 4 protein [Pseudonocardiales bacterium]